MNIIGTGGALPDLTVENHELSAFLDTSDEWIQTRTGIRERRVLADGDLAALAATAARRALENADVDASELDMILCSTVLHPNITPALACAVQGALGAACPATDINSACAGFLYGLELAEGLLATGRYRRILLVCAENTTRMADWRDRATCVLFGDGAGAVVLAPGDALESIRLTCAYNPEILYATTAPGNNPFLRHTPPAEYLRMNGQEVFKFAVEECVRGIQAAVAAAKLTLSDIHCFLLHQANGRIIKMIASRLAQDITRFPTNLERLGNTSSASIPLLLDELARAGRFVRGQRLVFSAFGAGTVAGTCVLQWTK